MHIGLIGGIGPAATIAYYRRLLAVFKAAAVPLELTIVHADAQTLSQNAAKRQTHEQAEIFARHIDQLKGAGCDVATITALTGHFCFDETSALSVLPLINPIDLIDQNCAQNHIKTIGLLGSFPVLDTRLFGQLQETRTLVPAGDLRAIGDAYMAMALAGASTEADRIRFIGAGANMIKEQGADAVLLAGTDLGLVFDNASIDYRVIDALEIHVQGVLQYVGH